MRELTSGSNEDQPFKVGEIVKTIKGARFWGEVVSVYRISLWLEEGPGNGPPYEWRVDVRATHPEFRGTIHVYPAEQLGYK